MRPDSPEHAIVAMAFLTALAIAMVWAVETLTKLLR
jgi:hypothetical protein